VLQGKTFHIKSTSRDFEAVFSWRGRANDEPRRFTVALGKKIPQYVSARFGGTLFLGGADLNRRRISPYLYPVIFAFDHSFMVLCF
jgi:hypothetical protein